MALPLDVVEGDDSRRSKDHPTNNNRAVEHHPHNVSPLRLFLYPVVVTNLYAFVSERKWAPCDDITC